MMFLFVAMVHIPRVSAAPKTGLFARKATAPPQEVNKLLVRHHECKSAFGQALPTFNMVPTEYSHEVNAELLYDLGL
jgi:hypothetical protein